MVCPTGVHRDVDWVDLPPKGTRMEQDLLRIGTAAQADRLTLSLDGELDLSNAALLIERLACALQTQPGHLDVELSSLAYCDSVGLSVFVTAHFQCLDARIPLRFLNPNLFIRELLAVTGLEEVLLVANTDVLVGA